MSDLSMKATRDDHEPRRSVSNKRSAPPSGGGMGPVARVLIVIVTMVMGGGVWVLWEKVSALDLALTASSEALRSSQDQLGSLSEQLQTQDKSLSKTGSTVKTSLATLDSEVRKLWDLSNKRNRPDIDKLQKDMQGALARIEALSGEGKTLATRLEKANSENAALSKQVAELGQALKKAPKVDDKVAAIKQELANLAAAQSKLSASQDRLSQSIVKLQLQADSQAKVPKPTADVGVRIAEIEGDIKAINAHRQQLNARISEIYQQIESIDLRTR